MARKKSDEAPKQIDAETRNKQFGIVSGRMDVVLRSLASLEKTAGYQALGTFEREKIHKTLTDEVSRVLNSFNEGKRSKVTTFSF